MTPVASLAAYGPLPGVLVGAAAARPRHWVAPGSEGGFVYGWQQVQDPSGASIRMSRE